MFWIKGFNLHKIITTINGELPFNLKVKKSGYEIGYISTRILIVPY